MASLTLLANELIIIIGEFCPVPDLARLARTQRRFNDLLRSSIFERNLREEPYRESCVLYAAAHKRMDILEIALAHGADMNGRPVPAPVARSTRPRRRGGFPVGAMRYNCEYAAPRPLHVAVWNGDMEMVQFLLDNGAAHDAAWTACEDHYDRKTQRLPSFLEEEAVSKMPLPPSGIRSDLTLDLFVREVCCVGPAHRMGRMLPAVCSILGMDTPRMLRETYPLLIALSLPKENDIGSILLRKGARLVSTRGYQALLHAVLVGNTRLFDELLQHYPATEAGSGSVRHRAFHMLLEQTSYIPMDILRHAFIRLWDPNTTEVLEQCTFSTQEVCLIFFSIITGRFKEALSVMEMTDSTFHVNHGEGLIGELLRHVWWYGDRESYGEPGPRVLDDNPLATKCELTKVLLQRGFMANGVHEVSYASPLHVSPLYLAAIGSAGCPYRSEALRLMLEAGHKYNCIVVFEPGQKLSLLRYFLDEAAKQRNLSKFMPSITMCLEFGVRIHERDYRHCYGCSGDLEFSMQAWREPDGRHPLFDFILEHATERNLDVKYIRFLLGKDFVCDNPQLRNSLFKFAENALGESVTQVGPPPAPVLLG